MKNFYLFLSLLLTFSGAAKAQAQALTKVTGEPESGIYVIYATTDEATPKKGYIRHDVATSGNRDFRLFDNVNLAEDGISAEDAENLKYCWLLVKDTDGSFSLQNLSTTTYMPADAERNKNMTGSEPANIMLEAVSDGDNSVWYAYQTNYKNGDNRLYIHSNAWTTDGANGNLSYWDNISETCVRLTFYSLSDEQQKDVIEAAVPNYESLSGYYVGAKSAKVYDKLKAEPTLENLILYVNSTIAFDAAKYYRIVCVSPKANATDGTSRTTMSIGNDDKAATEEPSQSQVNQIWQFVPTDNETENSYKLKNLNKDLYINPIDAGNYRATFVQESEAGIIEILAYGNGQFRLHNKNSSNSIHCLFCENNTNEGFAISGWENGAGSASAWRLYPVEDIELVLNSADSEEYWGTGYLPFAVTAADAEIYTATRSGDVLNLAEAAAGVQAENGFIVKGTAGTAKLNVLYEAASAATSELGGTLLGESGITANDYYVLSYGSAGVGFYHPSADALLPNKAYLQAGSGENTNVLRFDFGGATTAIGAVQSDSSAEAALYDLSGRRVTTPVRGIYVKGGQKVLMR